MDRVIQYNENTRAIVQDYTYGSRILFEDETYPGFKMETSLALQRYLIKY